MKAKDAILDLVEMSATSALAKSKDYYHGTTKAGDAESIISQGIQPGNVSTERGHQMTPVKGMVYLTPHIGYAQIYAIGGNYAGHKLSDINKPGERFGWLFVIDGKDLVDVQPDEDSVGELVYHLGNAHRKDYHYLEPNECSPWDDGLKAAFKKDPKFAQEVLKFLKRHMSYVQFKKSVDGEAAFFASGGKRVLRSMPDEMKSKLVDLGTHVSHVGTIHPREAWRIDKFYVSQLKKDGSNFFQLAKQIV